MYVFNYNGSIENIASKTKLIISGGNESEVIVKWTINLFDMIFKLNSASIVLFEYSELELINAVDIFIVVLVLELWKGK